MKHRCSNRNGNARGLLRAIGRESDACRGRDRSSCRAPALSVTIDILTSMWNAPTGSSASCSGVAFRMGEESNVSANVRRARYARSQHRARQHEDAHAESHAHGAVPEHPGVPRGDATLITTDAGLAELLSQLRAVGSFA